MFTPPTINLGIPMVLRHAVALEHSAQGPFLLQFGLFDDVLYNGTLGNEPPSAVAVSFEFAGL